MTTAAGQNILILVNDKLDPGQILRLIGWRPEMARSVGPAIHAFCPLHKGAYTTLIVDKRRRTFTCSLRDCRGHVGGTLLELWAAVNKVEPVRAALELCEQLNLQVDAPARAVLGAYLFDGAEVAYVKRHLTEAEHLAERALTLSPDYADARLLIAKIRLDQGNTPGAKQEYLTLAATLEKRGELRRAREVYERVLQFDPDCPETRAQLARIHKALGNPAQSLDIYGALAAACAARGDHGGRAHWLERILDTDATLTSVREDLAGLLIEENRTEEGLTQLRLMAEQLRLAGQAREAARIMERIARLRPEELEAREAQAALTLESGDVIAARQLYATLADEYLAKENWEGALACLTQLAETDPEDMDVRRRLARLHESLGQWAPAISLYRNIAAATLRIGDAASAIDALQRLIDLDKDNLAYRSDLAEALRKVNRLEEALEQYQVIAQRQFEQGLRDEGFQTCCSITRLGAALLEHRLRVARRYAQFGLKPQAIEEYNEIAQAAAQEGNTRIQALACDEGLAISADMLSLMELRYLAARDAKPVVVSEVVAQGKAWIDRLLEEGMRSKAEETIHECLTLAPDDSALRVCLFELCAHPDRVGDCFAELQALDTLLAGKQQGAELTELYQRFLALAPDHTAARQRLMTLYQESGDTSKVIESLRAQADHCRQTGDLAGARQALERILELMPEDPQCLWQIAEIESEAGSFAAAVPNYLRALNAFKGMRSPDEMRAAYAGLQQRDENNRDVRRAYAEYLDSVGDAAAAHSEYQKLAEACAAAGDEGAAVAAYQRAVHLAPEDRVAGGALIDLLRTRGDLDEAASHCLRLADLCRASADPGAEENYLKLSRELLPGDWTGGMRLARLLAQRNAAGEARTLLLAMCDELAKTQNWPQLLDVCSAGLGLLRQDAGLLARRAQAYRNLGDLERAASDFKERAALLEAAGAIQEAESAWLSALEDAPADVDCLEHGAGIHLRAGAAEKACECLQTLCEQRLVREQPDKACEALRRIIEIHPDDTVVRERLAALLSQLNQAQQAAEEQLKVCDLFVQQGHRDRALAMLEPIVRQYPELLKARSRLIALQEEAGQTGPASAHCMEMSRRLDTQGAKSEALEWVERAAKLAPENIEALQAQTQLLLALNQKQAAGDCLRTLSGIFERRGDLEQALARLSQVCDLEPDNLALREQRAALLEKAGRRDEAIDELLAVGDSFAGRADTANEQRCQRAILALAPGHPRAVGRLAQLCLDAGHAAEAASYWLQLAQAKAGAKDLAGAAEILRRVTEIEPALLEAHERLVEVLERMGQNAAAAERCMVLAELHAGPRKAPQDALAAMARAKRLQPGNIPIRRRYLNFLMGMGRNEEAAAECQDACQAALALGDKASAESFAELARPLGAEARLAVARLLFGGGRRERAQAESLDLLRELESHQEWARMIDLLGEAGDLIPEDEDALSLRLRAHKELGQRQDAANAAKKLADLARAQGRMDATMTRRREATQLAPEDTDALAALAALHQELNQVKEACGCWLQLSALFERRKSWEQALDAMNRACGCDSKNLALREQRAALLERAGKTNERIQELLILARAYVAQADAAQGRRLYETLLSGQPDNLQALEDLAQLLMDSGQAADACERFLDLADRQSAAGDRSGAVQALRQAAQIAPEHPGAQERLADMLEQMRDGAAMAQFGALCDLYLKNQAPRKAIAVLGRAKRFQSSNHDVRKRLVELYTSEGQANQASIEALDACRDALSRGDKSLAMTWIERIAGMSPDDPAPRLASARLLQESQCAEEARQTIHALLRQLEAAGNWPLLLDVCQQADELLPDDLGVLASRRIAHLRLNHAQQAISAGVSLAARLRTKGDAEQALAIYRETLSLAPENAPCLEGAAQLLREMNRKPEELEYLIKLAGVHERAGALDAALGVYQRLLEGAPENLMLREQRAAVLGRAGRAAQRSEELLALAREHIRCGADAEARRIYEALLSENPDHIEALEELARTLKATGEDRAACDRLMDLSQRRIAAGDADGAIHALESLLEIEPDNIEALERKAQAHERLGDAAGAVALYLRLGEWHAGQRAPQQAIAFLRRAKGLQPGSLLIRSRLIELCERQGAPDEAARESLESCRQAFEAGESGLALEMAAKVSRLAPDSIADRLAVVQLLKEQNCAAQAGEEAHALLSHLVETQCWDDALAVCAIAQEQNVEEAEILRSRFAAHRGLGHEREALIDGKRLARLKTKQGHVAEAISMYEDLLTGVPRETECLESLADLLEASSEAGASARAADCLLRLSGVFEEESDYDQAIACHRRALEKTLDVPEAHLALADLYGRVERGPERTEEMLAAARLYARQGHPDKSREIYEQVLRSARDNRIALAELAELCLAGGDVARAGALMMLLSDQHRAEGEWDAAAQLIQRAISLSPENIACHERLAALFEEEGDHSSATGEYLQICDLHCKLNAMPQAIAALRHVKQLQPDNWDARARLVEFLEQQNLGEEAAGECLDLCRGLLLAGAKSEAAEWAHRIPGLTPKALALRLDAIRLLAEHGAIEEARNEILPLSRRLGEGGRWEDALALCREASGLFPDDPEALSLAIEAHRKLGHSADILNGCKRLMTTFRAKGDSEAALNACQQALEQAPDDEDCLAAKADLCRQLQRPEPAAEALRRLSALAERRSDFERAIQLLRQAVESGPARAEDRMELADLFGRAGMLEQQCDEWAQAARTEMGKGAHEAAGRLFDLILGQLPDHMGALEGKAEVSRKAGDSETACECWMKLAGIFRSGQNPAQAIEPLRAVIEAAPDNADARARLAALLVELGQRDAAAGEWAGLANLLEEQAAHEPAAPPQSRPVSAYWTRALELAPRRDDLRMRRAGALEREEAWDEAASEYLMMAGKRAERRDHAGAIDLGRRVAAIAEKARIPDLAADCHAMMLAEFEALGETAQAVEELLWLSAALLAKGKRPEAEKLIARGMKMAPEHPRLHVRQGDMLLEMKRKGEAIQAFQRALKIYEAAGDEKNRIGVFKKILEQDSQNATIQSNLVDVLLATDRIPEALEQCWLLADQLIKRGYLDRAESAYRRIVQWAPDDIRAWQRLIETHLQIGPEEDLSVDYMTLAEVYAKAEKISEAVKTLRRVVEMEPANIPARRRYVALYQQIGSEADLIDDYLALAQACYRSGELAEARGWYEGVHRLDPSNKDAADFLERVPQGAEGGSTATRGRETSANAGDEAGDETLVRSVGNYLKVLKVNPDAYDARIRLAELYDRMGREDEAFEHWSLASETLMQRGETLRAVEILERLRKRRPDDESIQERLSKTRLKRDALKAIDSLFAEDKPGQKPPPKTDKKKKK